MRRGPGLNPPTPPSLSFVLNPPPQLSFMMSRFVDIDAFIMNPKFKLEWLLDVAKKQQQTGGIDGWGEYKKQKHEEVAFRCLFASL